MVSLPTLQRHELAKSIHATFLYPTARLPPLFDAVASGARRTSKARSCSQTTTWILGAYPFSSRCTTKSIAKKSPTGSLPPAVPLAITRTFRPWTHTSDDSYYIYQLSLVVATATVSSRMGFSIPTARRFSSNVAHSRSRAFRYSFFCARKSPYEYVDSVRIEPTKLILVGTRITSYPRYQLCGVLGLVSQHL